MDEAVRQLLLDSRLSSDARVIGMYVASLGPGAHEIDQHTLRRLLGANAGRRRVQEAVRDLMDFGWIERTPGGRGHADRYEFRCAEIDHLKDRCAQTDHLKDRCADFDHLKNLGAQNETTYPFRCAESDHLNAVKGGTIGRDSGVSLPLTSTPATTTTTTAGADEREDAKRAMWADAREAAERIEHPTRRRAFEASLRGLIEGDDYAAWRDQNGDQIPWHDRPRLLRMAIDRFMAGEARDVRFALDRFVIPQQYDPFSRRKAEDRRAERASIPAAPVAPSDIIRALEIGGAWLATAASREAGLRKIKQDDPALWARAGPILRHMNLTALWASYENRAKAPRKFEDDVRYAIEDAAQRLRDAS